MSVDPITAAHKAIQAAEQVAPIQVAHSPVHWKRSKSGGVHWGEGRRRHFRIMKNHTNGLWFLEHNSVPPEDWKQFRDWNENWKLWDQFPSRAAAKRSAQDLHDLIEEGQINWDEE